MDKVTITGGSIAELPSDVAVPIICESCDVPRAN